MDENVVFDMGNVSRTISKLFTLDQFDPYQAKRVMKILCTAYFEHNPMELDPDLEYCNATYDTYSCWPATVAGKVAEVRCPRLPITDYNKNATRTCFGNGTWDLAMYNSCIIADSEEKEVLGITHDEPGLRLIYNVGYTITTIALFIALAIFVYFRSLRCIRNTIHCHLIVAFIFNNISFVIVHNTIIDMYHNYHGWVCRAVVVAFNYFLSVPFFWMFVEGLYLYTIVVWAFSLQKIRMWYYIFIGWGLPLVFTIAWAVVRSKYHDVWCWLPAGPYHYDYIIYTPILLVLACNVFFIVDIVWVLVTKLRASNTLETRRSRKAVKATLVLLPLLGLTFMLFIAPPSNDPIVKKVCHYVDGVVHSLQGLFVAIIYCFMNGEVKTVLRKKFISIQDSRALTRYTKSSIFSSPHRSSGYAMQQLTASNQGKSICDGSKRASNESGNSKLSPAEDPETEACACMIENIT